MPATITPEELSAALKKSGAKTIDVRTPVEFREMHVEGAVNVPMDRIDINQFDKEETIYVLCRGGGRAGRVCAMFEAAGYDSVIKVEGGTLACEAAGLRMVRGKKTISLERQVRIVGGLLVLLGVLLGHFVAYPWFALSGFVGAGLFFAGVTDTCGMGMLLARMPWNQVRDSGVSCSMK